MSKHHNKIIWAVILSETSHIFCCVLPVLLSVLSLFSGLGFIAVMPPQLVFLHDFLHAYEPWMIAFSALVLALGWGLYAYGEQEKRKSHECCAHHAAPHKTAYRVLIIASVLFAVNVAVYFGVHRDAASHGHEQEVHKN